MSRSTLIVFYGPKQITDGSVLDKIAAAIDSHKDYPVSNSTMGGDTQVGTVKNAIAVYRLAESNSALRGRIASEGQSLPFGTDIQYLEYGGKTISTDDSPVYSNAYANFLNNTPFPVNNGSMGGDPLIGTLKSATAIYYRNGQTAVQESRTEGQQILWHT